MKMPFIIYAQSIGIYLLFTIPAVAEPAIYIISAGFVLLYGFVAMAVFVAVFFALRLAKASADLSINLLVIAVIIAVGIAYKILLVTAMQETDFWQPGIYGAFPITAILCGWTAIAINRKRIVNHFNPLLPGEIEAIEGYETIFTYDKTTTK